MKFAVGFVVALLPTYCLATTPRPVTLSTFALQCQATRSVVCVVDYDLTVDQCRAAVPAAVAAINEAVGRELLRFDGYITPQGASNAWRQGVVIVMGQAELGGLLGRVDAQILGFTPSQTTVIGEQVCLTRTMLLLDPRLFGAWHQHLHGTVLHELLHAIGIAHAPNFAPPTYKSVMAPSADSPSHSETLTPADKYSLKTIYG